MSPSSKLKDSRSTLVDAYIAKAAPFAQPILWHVRELVHKAAPGVEEVIKWSRPFFMYRGIILGNMSAFKAHCSFGLWGEEITAKMRADGATSNEGMGTFGRLETLKDLPGDKKLLAYIQQAVAAIDEGTRTKSYTRPPRVAKPELDVPADLAAALKKNKAAQKVFDAFAPSHQREYIAWITEAKREETRASRVTQTVDWLAEGKRRNWKYENC
jgi:uncharacterized protein YdeI (YjbR/CyaY-like superfamily)